jgi:hypothetical protein
MVRRGELFKLWPEWRLRAKQREAAALRLELLTGQYKKRVQKMVRERLADGDSVAEIQKCVQTVHGLFATVAETLSVVYDRGCRRELVGADEPTMRAFADIVAESQLPILGPSLNVRSWALGPIVLSATVQEVHGVSELCLHEFTPDRTCVRYNPARPDVIKAVLYQRPEDDVFVLLDDREWSWWSPQGDRLDIEPVAHGLSYCPAAVFRSRLPPTAADWAGTLDHVGLIDATLEVAFRHALGLWVRQVTAAPLIAIVAPHKDVAKGQSLGHPSRPLWFDAAPQTVDVKVLDRTTSAQAYLAEIQALVNVAVARYGIDPASITYTNDQTNWGALSIAARGEGLARQRDSQVRLVKAAEMQLWPMLADIVRASEHRHAGAMPRAEKFREMLTVEFPDLASPADIRARMEAFELEQKHGQKTVIDLLMERRPELTREEATRVIDSNYQDYAARLEFIASRNVTMDPERGVQSIAEVQGREGGRRSGEVRRAQDQQQP